MQENGVKSVKRDGHGPFPLSAWLLLGLGAALWCGVLIVSLRPQQREEDVAVRTLGDRADALIWALEAGTRTWMGNLGDDAVLQRLVEETAKQPGIRYIAVVDGEGDILSHSDAKEVGGVFDVSLPGGLNDVGEKSGWRVRDGEAAPVFEVRRLFVPVAGDHHAFSNYQRSGHHGRGMRMGMGMGMPRGKMRGREGMMRPIPAADPGKSYVFVGMDYAPIAEALGQDRHRRLLTTLLVGLLGLGGLLCGLWARGYRRYRRMLAAAHEEVERGRRLTALGNLAAGVAHEIRNPLSSIKGLATYLSRRVPEGGAEAEAAQTMVGEVERLNRVVSGLLDFARPGLMKRAPADVNVIVGTALRLADADIRAHGVKVDFRPVADLPTIPVNREKLTQALLNLFLNAVQAMQDGGELGVEAVKTGGRLVIRVRDTGKGMTDEVRAAIFTPYYTTKASGTGLGLAIVHQIVEGHGGTIGVESSPGKGSVFTLDFPATAGESDPPAR